MAGRDYLVEFAESTNRAITDVGYQSIFGERTGSGDPADSPGLTTLVGLAVSVIVVAGLYLGREVLIPITLSVLLSFILAPLANLIRTIGVGRLPSVLLAVGLALGVVLALSGLIGAQVADLAEQTPQYQHAIRTKLETARSLTLGKISSAFRNLGRQLEPSDNALSPKAENKCFQNIRC